MSWLTRLFHRNPESPPDVSHSVEPPPPLDVKIPEVPPSDSAKLLISKAEKSDVFGVSELLESGTAFETATLGDALYWAQGSGTPEITRMLLAAGVDVDYQGEFGDTALMAAVKKKDVEGVRALLKAGANPTVANVHGESPLKVAFEDEGDEMKLIAAELDQARPGKVDGNTLVTAAACGSIGLVRHALDAGASVNSTNEFGSPTLLVAAQAGRAEAVKLLLAHGASPDTARDDGQETALTAAVCGRSEEVVRVLIEAGADVTVRRGFDDGTPESVAEWLGETAIARLLHAAALDPPERLVFAARWTMMEEVNALLSSGARFDKTVLGRALQNVACAYGTSPLAPRPEIARALIASGAEVDFRDERQMTPLLTAVYAEHIELVRLLLAEAADPTLADADGVSPLSAAERCGDVEPMKTIAEELRRASAVH